MCFLVCWVHFGDLKMKICWIMLYSNNFIEFLHEKLIKIKIIIQWETKKIELITAKWNRAFWLLRNVCQLFWFVKSFVMHIRLFAAPIVELLFVRFFVFVWPRRRLINCSFAVSWDFSIDAWIALVDRLTFFALCFHLNHLRLDWIISLQNSTSETHVGTQTMH